VTTLPVNGLTENDNVIFITVDSWDKGR